MSLPKHSSSNVIALLKRIPAGMLLALMLAAVIGAQQPQSNSVASQNAATWAVEVRLQYGGAPNVAYIGASNREAILDVYTPRSAASLRPCQS